MQVGAKMAVPLTPVQKRSLTVALGQSAPQVRPNECLDGTDSRADSGARRHHAASQPSPKDQAEALPNYAVF